MKNPQLKSSIQHCTRGSTQCRKKEKVGEGRGGREEGRKKGKGGKEGGKKKGRKEREGGINLIKKEDLSLFSGDIILDVEDSKEFTKKLLELIHNLAMLQKIEINKIGLYFYK